jgi:hypothetical protein
MIKISDSPAMTLPPTFLWLTRLVSVAYRCCQSNDVIVRAALKNIDNGVKDFDLMAEWSSKRSPSKQ